MLKEPNVRKHHMGGGLAILVEKDQDAIIVPGAQGTAIMVMVMVRQEKTLKE